MSRRKRGLEFKLKVGPKNQSFQFKLKFGTKDNSSMQNSVVMSTFSPFQKCPF